MWKGNPLLMYIGKSEGKEKFNGQTHGQLESISRKLIYSMLSSKIRSIINSLALQRRHYAILQMTIEHYWFTINSFLFSSAEAQKLLTGCGFTEVFVDGQVPYSTLLCGLKFSKINWLWHTSFQLAISLHSPGRMFPMITLVIMFSITRKALLISIVQQPEVTSFVNFTSFPNIYTFPHLGEIWAEWRLKDECTGCLGMKGGTAQKAEVGQKGREEMSNNRGYCCWKS